MACFGPGALEGKGFFGTKAAGDTPLAGGSGSGSYLAGSGCTAGRARATPAALLLLLTLLLALRRAHWGESMTR